MRQYSIEPIIDQFPSRRRDMVVDLALGAFYILEAISLHFSGLDCSSREYLHKGIRRLLDFAINAVVVLGFRIAILAGIILGLVGLVLLGIP